MAAWVRGFGAEAVGAGDLGYEVEGAVEEVGAKLILGEGDRGRVGGILDGPGVCVGVFVGSGGRGLVGAWERGYTVAKG